MTPLDRYNAALESAELTPDEEQHKVVCLLQSIYEELIATPLPSATKQGLFSRLLRSKSKPVPKVQGLYLWGGVGRGKTLLTDMFVDCIPFTQKRRLHFHRFMKNIHDELKLHKGEEDPLLLIAEKWIGQARLLVLDEMHVNDITDAMLLGKLLSALFDKGLTLVTTSNVHPDDLYRDGLQRDRFIPAIEQIKKHTNVYEMPGMVDFRLRLLESANTYLLNSSADVDSELQAHFDKLCGNAATVSTSPMNINQRDLPVIKKGDGVIWFEFDTLCNTPRSTHDYIEIATLFHTVIISNVEVLNENRNDSARRWVNLIDELYDRGVNVIISAQAMPEELYTGERLAFEYARAASRLREMQTKEYLARPHLGL